MMLKVILKFGTRFGWLLTPTHSLGKERQPFIRNTAFLERALVLPQV